MSMAGNWTVTMKTPMGDQTAALALKDDGGTWSGTITDPSGAVQPLQNVRATGNALEWKVDIKSPMPLSVTFNVNVEGDSLSGKAVTMLGSAPVSGVRG